MKHQLHIVITDINDLCNQEGMGIGESFGLILEDIVKELFINIIDDIDDDGLKFRVLF